MRFDCVENQLKYTRSERAAMTSYNRILFYSIFTLSFSCTHETLEKCVKWIRSAWNIRQKYVYKWKTLMTKIQSKTFLCNAFGECSFCSTAPIQHNSVTIYVRSAHSHVNKMQNTNKMFLKCVVSSEVIADWFYFSSSFINRLNCVLFFNLGLCFK